MENNLKKNIYLFISIYLYPYLYLSICETESNWMDKEDVAHIYNGILHSHKKTRNWVICSEVDGPR